MNKGNSRSWSAAVICAVALTLAAANLWGRGQAEAPATLVLRNGRIVTMDDAKPEVQAVAARGETIVAVGTNDEVARLVGKETRVIDLAGRLAIPAFIEGHAHFMGVGEAAHAPRPDEREELGRGGRDGRRGGEDGQAGRRGSPAAAGTRRSGTARRSRRSKGSPCTTA